MTTIDRLLETAGANASASRLLADIAIRHYADALRTLFPAAKSLSWESGTQFDDSNYYAAIEDIHLHVDGKPKLYLGTAGELSDFPNYFGEWIDFDVSEEHEGSSAPEGFVEERFSAHMAETYGLAPCVDWRRLGSIVDNILALCDDSDNFRSLDPTSAEVDDRQREALRSVLGAVETVANFGT
jgi:hypothetical protein